MSISNNPSRPPNENFFERIWEEGILKEEKEKLDEFKIDAKDPIIGRIASVVENGIVGIPDTLAISSISVVDSLAHGVLGLGSLALWVLSGGNRAMKKEMKVQFAKAGSSLLIVPASVFRTVTGFLGVINPKISVLGNKVHYKSIKLRVKANHLSDSQFFTMGNTVNEENEKKFRVSFSGTNKDTPIGIPIEILNENSSNNGDQDLESSSDLCNSISSGDSSLEIENKEILDKLLQVNRQIEVNLYAIKQSPKVYIENGLLDPVIEELERIKEEKAQIEAELFEKNIPIPSYSPIISSAS